VRELDISTTEIEGLGEGAFSGAEELHKVLVPRTLKKICAECFWWSGVKEVDLSTTEMEEFGERAFYGAEALEKVWHLGR
jgi:hypothetical protein